MEQKRPYVRRIPAAEEENKVWVSFYRNANDPDLAAELIAHMDKDADSRAQYPGLYLKCKQSVRRERERQARARRYANALRMVLRIVLRLPGGAVAWSLRWTRSLARFSGDVALDICDDKAPAASDTERASSARRAVADAKAASTTDNQKPAVSTVAAVPAAITTSA
jgi:hypothetical protein